MICGKCGTENLDTSKFCRKCGNNLQTNFQMEQKPSSQLVNEQKDDIRKVSEKWKTILVYAVIFIAAIGISKVMVDRCLEDLERNADDNRKSVVELDVEELEELTKDEPVVEGLYEKTDKPRNPEAIQAFTQTYGGVWYLTKEFTGESWRYHDLTKKLVLMAWNHFNDYDVQEVVGSYKEKRTFNYYYNGKLVASKDGRSRTKLIFGDTKHYDGFDIKYNEKYIILTDNEVDLTGIGGPVFSIEDFRYENVRGYDYLISDIYGFGLVWDGTYLEYCEPKEDNEFYQGLYAFRIYSMDELINQNYNDK